MSKGDPANERAVAVGALRNVVTTARDALNYALREKEGLELVTFEWSTEKGQCNECGLPAAYSLAITETSVLLLCSVCAALHASEGETITYLYRENEEEQDD